MTHPKLTLLTTLAVSTMLFAGCTTTSTTNTNTAVTNTTANTNVVVANTNSTNTVVVTNDNSNDSTNVDQGIDTSDWLTYANEEYGFSFKYPSDWGEVTVTKTDASDTQVGSKAVFLFSKDDYFRSNLAVALPTIEIKTNNYQLTTATDGQDLNINNIDLSQSDDVIIGKIKRYENSTINLQRLSISNLPSLRLKEKYQDEENNQKILIYYVTSKFNSILNFELVSNEGLDDQIKTLVSSITFN